MLQFIIISETKKLVVMNILTTVHSVESSQVTDTDTTSLANNVGEFRIFWCNSWFALVNSEGSAIVMHHAVYEI